MVAVPFPSSSTPGRLPGEGEGRLINAYVEKGGDTAYWRRVPGLNAVVNTGGTSPPRGMIVVNDYVFAAYSGAVIRVSADNTLGSSGSLPGTDWVTWARNNKVSGTSSVPDVVAVRQSGGAYAINYGSGTIAPYADTDLPATVNSVDSLGGYFLFTVPDGRIFASELNSTDINPLSFATAESSSDGLLRGIVANNKFYAMGTATIEPWLNVGNTPFPLARATTVISVGLLAPFAVAGFGEGWDRNPYFVAHDGTVRELTGYTTKVVSTPDVEAFIARSTVSTLEASVYTFRGRAIWSLSSDQGTWELETSTGLWHERQSAGATRWRASRSIKRNNQWVFGDTLSGNLLAVSDATRTEASQPLTWTVESGPLREFPTGIMLPDVEFAFTPSAGATAAISWSIDGGVTWGVPVSRALKADGVARFPVRVNVREASSHHGIRFRASVSDDADFSFMGAAVPQPQPRAT